MTAPAKPAHRKRTAMEVVRSIRQPGDCACVAFADVALAQSRLDCRIGVEQPEGVGNGGTRFSYPARHFLLGKPELVHELAESRRLFERVQVGALHVLHERQRQLLALIGATDYDGHSLEARHLGRPQPPFAGNEHPTRRSATDQQWLEHAMLGNAGGKLL